MQKHKSWAGSYFVIILLSVVLMQAGAFAAAAAPAKDNDIASAKKTGSAFTEVAKKAIPAVVFVKVEKTIKLGTHGNQQFYFRGDPSDMLGDELMNQLFRGYNGRRQRMPEFKQQGQGSGFIISKDGYILTNNHVVGDADKIMVRLHDGRELPAKRIGSDPKSEVALIKIEGENLPYLKSGSSRNLEIGEWVIAVGNPFGLNETLTVGVVSAKGRSGMGIADYEDFIQTDAAINPGNSGGPLLNIDGEVIGINTAIFSGTGGSLGIGFAIPIDMVMDIKDQLVKNGKVSRGYIGVYLQEITEEIADSMGVKGHEGALVADVTKDSPAAKSGLKHGDIISTLNGRKVKSVGEFRNEVASNPPGTKLSLTVLRDGASKEYTVITGSMPSDSVKDVPQVSGKEDKHSRFGMGLKNLTPELAKKYDLEIEKGVVVDEVEESSAAARLGVQPGFVISGVNRKAVSSVAEFDKAIAESKKMVLLRITDGNISRFVPMKKE